MDRRYKRNLFVAAMFYLLNTGLASAQTATNLNCFKCVGQGEVANNAVSWLNLDGAARGYLINQANNVAALANDVAALEAQPRPLQVLAKKNRT